MNEKEGITTSIQLAILETLYNGDYHALELMDLVAPKLGGKNPGMRIYPVLRQLEADGYIESWEGYARPPERAERQRRYYKLGAKGQVVVGVQDHIVDEPQPQMLPTAIEGYYVAMAHGGPVAMRMGGSMDKPIIPVFSSQIRLDAFLSGEKTMYQEVGRVKGALNFLESMKQQGLRVGIDPHRRPNGNIRWIEIHDVPKVKA